MIAHSLIFSSFRLSQRPLPTLIYCTRPALKSSNAVSFLHTSTMSEKTGFYSLKAEMPGNKTFDFADLEGKVVLIVNTASAWWGLALHPRWWSFIQAFLLVGSRLNTKVRLWSITHVTRCSMLSIGLQALYDKYKDRNFTIVGFPCNQVCLIHLAYSTILTVINHHFQFGGQEPLDDAGVAEFCTVNHGVTFPLMKKSEVNGDNTNEVYQFLKSQKSGILGLTRIKVRIIIPGSAPTLTSLRSGTLRNFWLTNRATSSTVGLQPPLLKPLMVILLSWSPLERRMYSLESEILYQPTTFCI